MACSNNEDDFWNQSSSSGFNFFEDDDESLFVETDVFSSFVQENITLPIHSLISNKSLTMILDDIDSTVGYAVPPPEETIKKMFHGENFVLNVYRTLEDKLSLLDTALDIGDGDIILAVIIFLMKSLKLNIFFNCLSKRKVAIKHYANYIIYKNNLQELADLYMATGNVLNLKDIYYLLSKDTTNYKILYKKLEQFTVHHSQNLYSVEDKNEIQENTSFIEYQIQHRCNNISLIDQLINLCKSEWEKGNGDEALYNFKKQFKIDDFHYDWVIMNVICKMKKWDKLVATFIKTVWVIKKQALKSSIRPDLFIIGISRHDPPKEVTCQFLSCVGDVSKSLYLAEKFKIHSYVINYYVSQKDRISLLKYVEKVEPGDTATHDAIHSALNSSFTKWKN